jgi:hypothetical protein
MIRKIKSISATVKHILETKPETRDSDRLLILSVWAYQNPRLRSKDEIFVDFAMDFYRGSYADTESIRRSRQKLQEQNPHLRGKTDSFREDLAEEMRTNINQM